MVHKTYKGGVAVVVKETSRELRKLGIKVDEITRNEDLKILSFTKSYFKLKSLFKKWSQEYDVIHTHDWSITYPAIKADVKNLVATFHAFPTNYAAKIFQNYCIRNLKSRAIVISPNMKRVYKNSTYIPNGVNLKIFKRKGKLKKGLVGLAQKYCSDEITKLLRELNLKYIETKGKWKYESLGKFYSMLNVFISIPYKQAGFNLVWIEAMACEVPYVIGTNDGIGEILPIYKVSNFHELKKLLKKIKGGEVKPLKSQRKWVIKHGFLWLNSAKKIIKIYSGIK